MSDLDKRFDDKIKKANFNFLEISGFKKKPMLAVKAGMALGYKMCAEDVKRRKSLKI